MRQVFEQMDQLAHSVRLFVDLLEHEVLIPAALRTFHTLGDGFNLAFDEGAIIHPPDLNPVRPQGDHLAISNAQDAPGEM
jgi:hypothetical protein